MTQQIISGEMTIMKKLGLALLALTLTSSAFADEMRTVLIQGTKINCKNDGKPVAQNSNLQVAIPESSLDGIGTFSIGDVELNRDVTVKMDNRTCTLPSGAVLEKVVIKIFCSNDSVLKYFQKGPDEWMDLELASTELCGGGASMFKRVAAGSLSLKNDKYYVGDKKEIYLSDSKAQFGGIINEDTKERANFFTSSSGTKYSIPFVRGVYVK